MVSIETYESKYKSQWDSFIDMSKNATFLFKRDFMDYHSSRFQDSSFFDFGTSNENEGRKVNSGLLYWKEGFGARSISQNFYEINTKDFKKLNNLMI